MRRFNFIILFISFFTIQQSCYKEVITYNTESNQKLELPTILKINNKECSQDYEDKKLRYPIESDVINNFSPFIEFQEYSKVCFEGVTLKNKSINNLGRIEINQEYEIIVETVDGPKKLKLTFTNLPVIQIITPSRIYDEPKILAKINVNYTEVNKSTDQYYIGLEHRGSTSQSHQKKSFAFSLKGSQNFDDNISHSFFDMKKNNDWILDAMWIDKSRIRNKVSFDLWRKFEGEKHYTINTKLVELYINNEHQGLYSLNENINPEFLNLNNAHAVLYKATGWEDGATNFETYTNSPPRNFFWDGWEQKYPDPKIEINWKPLDELRKLVVNGNNNLFTSQIAISTDINNLIDYYILFKFRIRS